ncbi:hypothetical protein [Klebsiella pneumoniae]|uniref:hypothetical protein n=1 Tax=Klebsiella pneumoniae TaxID=573 RepID=UPI0020CC02E4|nr:hypothetical protein [Klebsiella pneumoniae]MCQ0656277.1 hypothetical protein [Klebsiella pneumoniae]
MRFKDLIIYATFDDELRTTETENSDIQIRNVWRTLKKHNKVDLAKIVRDPIGNYMDMLREIDPDTWMILFGEK